MTTMASTSTSTAVEMMKSSHVGQHTNEQPRRQQIQQRLQWLRQQQRHHHRVRSDIGDEISVTANSTLVHVAVGQFFYSHAMGGRTKDGGDLKQLDAADWRTLPHRLHRLSCVLDRAGMEIDGAEVKDVDRDPIAMTAMSRANEEDQWLMQTSFCATDGHDWETWLLQAKRSALTAAILASAPPDFSRQCEILLRASLQARADAAINQLEGDDEDDDNVADVLDAFGYHSRQDYVWFSALQRLGWLVEQQSLASNKSNASSSGLLVPALQKVLQEVVSSQIQAWIVGDYERADWFPQVESWIDQVVLPWLTDLLGFSPRAESGYKRNWQQPIYEIAKESFCLIRFQELFEIITDFPDSQPAVLELKRLLESSRGGINAIPYHDADGDDLRKQVVYSDLGRILRQSLTRRLNHPGATTSQIIDVYIAAMQALRLLDPTDCCQVATITEPVRSYLRGRSDTVRCILTSLTTQSQQQQQHDLYQELRRQDAKPLDQVTADSDDEEEPPDLHHWQPPPSTLQQQLRQRHRGLYRFAQSATSSYTTRNVGLQEGDILAMLVHIYGSQECFVQEYRCMLADQLLQTAARSADYQTDAAVHTLELLKLRFGESCLRHCEVMIKDMADSRRTVTHIQEYLQRKQAPAVAFTREHVNEATKDSYSFPVDAVMLSHIFWPTLNKEKVQHHSRIQSALQEFGSAYANLRNPRRLQFLDSPGSVELEVDVLSSVDDVVAETDDGDEAAVSSKGAVLMTRSFTCSPVHATLLLHFEDQATWSVAALAEDMSMAEHVVQQRMAYWIHHRVVVLANSSNSKATGTGKSELGYELASHAYMNQPSGSTGTSHRDGGSSMDLVSDGLLLDDADLMSMGIGGGAIGAVSMAAQEAEQMLVYESYIIGMLTNLKELPLDRIHNMLKMFVTAAAGGGDGSDTVRYDKTPAQLSSFLQQLCRQDKLELGADGKYRLVKK